MLFFLSSDCCCCCCSCGWGSGSARLRPQAVVVVLVVTLVLFGLMLLLLRWQLLLLLLLLRCQSSGSTSRRFSLCFPGVALMTLLLLLLPLLPGVDYPLHFWHQDRHIISTMQGLRVKAPGTDACPELQVKETGRGDDYDDDGDGDEPTVMTIATTIMTRLNEADKQSHETDNSRRSNPIHIVLPSSKHLKTTVAHFAHFPLAFSRISGCWFVSKGSEAIAR